MAAPPGRLLIAIVALGLIGCSFRAARGDDVAAPPEPVVTVTYAAGSTEIKVLQKGAQYFSNSKVTLGQLPPQLEGLSFTYREAGKPTNLSIQYHTNDTVYLLIENDNGPNKDNAGLGDLHSRLSSSGWKRLPDISQPITTDTALPAVYMRHMDGGGRYSFPGVGYSGVVVAARNLAIATPKPPATIPAAGRIVKPQATVKMLCTDALNGVIIGGDASDCILTVTPGDSSKPLNFEYVTWVGKEMKSCTDDALRYVHLKNPTWYADKAEVTFGDRAPIDGPSYSAAVGILIRSVTEGFPIDDNAAITGDIAANGAIHSVFGITHRLHGAISGRCTIVAAPVENEQSLIDAAVYGQSSLLSDVQIIGVSNLDDAISVVRSDRDPKLQGAIAMFQQVQQSLKSDPRALASPQTHSQLSEVLTLAPKHLSARILLMVADKKLPKKLSARASLFYTDQAVSVMVPILDDRTKISDHRVAGSLTVQQQLADLEKLRPIADAQIVPYLDAWERFIRTWSAAVSGGGSQDAVNATYQRLTDEQAKLKTDPDLNQKLMNQQM